MRGVVASAIIPVLLLTLSACATRAPVLPFPEFSDPLAGGGHGPLMVRLPPGRFEMGDLHGDGGYDEYPVHRVRIPDSFAIGKYEITLAEFARFVEATAWVTEAESDGGTMRGCYVMGGDNWRDANIDQPTDRHPVTCISWNDAMAYTRWLSEQTGRQYRLPTEAEWEYAARGGGAHRYTWGDTVRIDRANCQDCLSVGNLYTSTIVGSFPANGFGLHDMDGNVWEWVGSEWRQAYDGEELRMSTKGPRDGERVLRSCSWRNSFADARVANRGKAPPMWRYNNLGFRVAAD